MKELDPRADSEREVEIAGTVLPPSEMQDEIIRDYQDNRRLRRITQLTVLSLFGVNNIACIVLYAWKAYALKGVLSERELLYFTGATVSQTAIIAGIAAKFLFGKNHTI